MTDQLAKTYDPSEVEQKWYQFWEENDLFVAEVDKCKEPFSVMMPPPNITGQLHLGHALDDTLQDIIVRWNRMKGKNTLWLPGTDHASIATEAKVVDKIRQEGKEKDELGREEFLKRAWEWKEEYGNRITNQIRNLGASCDWTRERFTLDEGCSKAVREVFVQLYEEGLIYQGDYIVNWCTDCSTTLSDIEVEHEETEGKLYYIKYPFKGEEGHITVATTRPETMLGDTAVAVDPSDERYAHLVGKTLIVPLVDREIKIIADEFVDSEFGTGMVKVTPAHDPNDFEIGERNDLEQIRVIDFDGRMTAHAGKYEGMKSKDCREQVINDLEELGLLKKVEKHEHSVGHCYRCDEVVEPMISKQWFVDMQPLAEPAIQAVKNGEAKFVPERFAKVYLNWMENIKDWCISRQLWWGHRIPVWYCDDCEAINVSREDLDECQECGSKNIKQDEDVLDTWFSSALWPFSTLGWPEETKDLDYFYPTDVLVTGRDIIFFWVARMIFMGIHIMGEKPFDTVYVHGLIRDAQGRKMSKSLGNGIDPLEVIEEYGADALRFMLVTGNTPGNDMRFRDERLNASRNFANKIWNAARFMLMHVEEDDELGIEEFSDDLTLVESWILSRLNDIIEEIDVNMDKYLFGEVSKHLYDFIWSEFCDWYLEMIKPDLYNDDNPELQRKTARVGQHLLSQILKLLHPIMPFITEEIWHKLPGTEGSIMTQVWPVVEEKYQNKAKQEQMSIIQDIIREIRNIRNEFKVNPGKKITAIFDTGDQNNYLTDEAVGYIIDLAGLEQLSIESSFEAKPAKAASAVVEDIDIILPLEGMIDIDKEIDRLKKEAEEVKSEINRAEQKLDNEGFVNQAPEELVQAEREKLPQYREKLEKINARIKELNK
ncbi:MAG: valine--tRNA ligase [Bacillota bacterium]